MIREGRLRPVFFQDEPVLAGLRCIVMFQVAALMRLARNSFVLGHDPVIVPALRCGSRRTSPGWFHSGGTPDQILAWADAHRQRTDCWPMRQTEPVTDAPGETWGGRGVAQGRVARPAGWIVAGAVPGRAPGEAQQETPAPADGRADPRVVRTYRPADSRTKSPGQWRKQRERFGTTSTWLCEPATGVCREVHRCIACVIATYRSAREPPDRCRASPRLDPELRGCRRRSTTACRYLGRRQRADDEAIAATRFGLAEGGSCHMLDLVVIGVHTKGQGPDLLSPALHRPVDSSEPPLILPSMGLLLRQQPTAWVHSWKTPLWAWSYPGRSLRSKVGGRRTRDSRGCRTSWALLLMGGA